MWEAQPRHMRNINTAFHIYSRPTLAATDDIYDA